MTIADCVFQNGCDRFFHSTHFSYNNMSTSLPSDKWGLFCPLECGHAGDREENDAM